MTATVPRGVRVACLALLLAAGCSPSPDELYSRGMADFKAGKTGAGTSDLESFVANRCGGGGDRPRCRHANLTLGHTYERQGALAKAWAAYDQALVFPPHKTDAALAADRDRVRDALVARQGQEAARTPVVVLYRDEVTEDFTPRAVAVSLDFTPIWTRDKDLAELRAPEAHRVYSGSVPAGAHLLVVDVAHACAPTAAPGCARSALHRAFPFTSEARTPVTLELRAYTQPEDDGAPAHPALELTSP
jgi:hypothetical protein